MAGTGGVIAKNALGNVASSVSTVVSTIGRAALHALAPDNFEYYMCSLELLDSSGNSLGFMYFPVMPSAISETRQPILSIVKTNRGVVSMFNDSFNPISISINGTFGRKLRLLLGITELGDVSANSFFGGNKTSFLNGNFYVRTGTGPSSDHIRSTNVLVKSGYGLIKMLKRMLDSAYKLDDKGNPCILLFSNYSLNTHYIVEPQAYSFTQNQENNTLWHYQIDFQAVAPASAVKTIDGGSFLMQAGVSAVSKGINELISKIRRLNPISLPL